MDVLDLGRYFASLLLVGGLLGGAWLMARRYGVSGFMPGSAQKRLAVVETLMIDARHKAFLLRRDGIEHLLVIGPNGTSVVENGIPTQLAQPHSESMTIAESAA
ncbi:MAG TPA: flagellar biosynthetic protein FliO [Rhizomicrobium sp.]|nr:flagellar biosynthetic protein FliO [Rhizomicrobium sp.]